MNDLTEAIPRLTQSPGYLLLTFGLQEILVLRPYGPRNKTRILSVVELDADICNRGPALLLRAVSQDTWSLLRFAESQTRYKYICAGAAFDYTAGNFYFSLTRYRTCTLVIRSITQMGTLTLLPHHYRHSGIAFKRDS